MPNGGLHGDRGGYDNRKLWEKVRDAIDDKEARLNRAARELKLTRARIEELEADVAALRRLLKEQPDDV